MANKPKITATSVEEFNKLETYFNDLPQTIRDDVESVVQGFAVCEFIHKKILSHQMNKQILIPAQIKHITVEPEQIIVTDKNGYWHRYPIEGENGLTNYSFKVIE